ncbi:MAG: chromosome segregation ATPase [Arenicella sp.]|jgi:chromosome segregation ATPase
MLSGTSALKNIDQSLQIIRNDVVCLDGRLSQLSSQMTANQRRRATLINDIASVRLAEIDSGELDANFSAADQYASEVLEQREQAQAVLNLTIDSINKRILDAEGARDILLETVNSASEKIVDIEGQVQQQLALDARYLAQFELAKQAESMAEEAQQKMQRSKADMTEKAEPYQADDLFMYLWQRGYGTTEYQCRSFARLIDGWVARVIKYEPSRVNYWNLIEIPRRLQEHAERVGDTADEQHMQLQQLELNALDLAGIVALESELEALRLTLDAHDDIIEELEAKLNQALDQRADYTSGKDNYMKRCLQRLSNSLEHQNLQSIHQYVRATISTTDDGLVVELQSLEASLDNIEGDLAQVRKRHDHRLNKLKELEMVRRDFKHSRFDDVRSGFGNQKLIDNALSQFIQGAVSGAEVWHVIKGNQRYRQVTSNVDFGSGGLGEIADMIGGEIMPQGRRQRRSSRGSSWNLPKPRDSGSKMPPEGGPSAGKGGFKTGGGF